MTRNKRTEQYVVVASNKPTMSLSRCQGNVRVMSQSMSSHQMGGSTRFPNRAPESTTLVRLGSLISSATLCICAVLCITQPGASQSPQIQQLQQQQQQQQQLQINNQNKTLVVTEKPPNFIETGRQITGILDRFMSLGYDKRVRPNYGGPPVEVNVTMRILSISSVSEVMMDFTADFYFRQTWHDPRLSFKRLGDIQTLYVGAEVSKKIWLPDTFFGNEKLAYFHEATTPNVFLRIDHSGEVYRSIRLTVTSSCPMNLQYFPMDRQRCTIEAESYGYNVKDIIYRWARETAVERDDQISLPQFDIVKTVQKYRLEELSSGTYSRLIAEIHFARRMGYYLIQIYIPSSLIVVISWVSFWLHRNASPARVQLGVTTVLTMTTLMSSTNAALPKISYVKSIDIFLGTCFIMVFAALLEYATVGYLGKRIAMRKAQLQHAHSQAQARLFAQLQAQGAEGKPVPPIPLQAATAAPPPDQINPLGGSPIGPATGFVTGQTDHTNWMDELTAMAAAANATHPAETSPFAAAAAAAAAVPPPPRRFPNGQTHTPAGSVPQVPTRHGSHQCHRANEANLFPCSDNSHAHQQTRSYQPPPPPPPIHQCRQFSSTAGSRPRQTGSCRCNCSDRHCCCARSDMSSVSRTLPRNLTFAMEDIHNHHLHYHACADPNSTADKLQQAMLGMNVSPNDNHHPLATNTTDHRHNHHSASLPPSYGRRGESSAAAAAAATFVNLHRKHRGLPPSTNPNFAQFSWMGQQNRSLETIFGIRPSDIDKYSRVVFPVCFVCFQLMYWIVYLHISAFLESEQQQQLHS